jgi:CRP-like cAMP-binding protein
MDEPRHALTERMIVLRTLPPLRTVEAKEIAAIARSLREARFAPGQTLLAEHETADALFLLLEGAVRVSHVGASFGEITAPGAAGLLPFYARSTRGTRIEAVLDTEVLVLDEDTMVEIMEEHFEMLQGILFFFAERLNTEFRSIFAGARATPSLEEVVRDFPELFPALVQDVDPAAYGPSLTLVERIFFFRSLVPFQKTNVNALSAWARRVEEVRYEPGDVIWDAGDTPIGPLFLVSGITVQEADGVSLPTQAPMVLGAAEAVLGQPRWTKCTALSPIIALRAPMEAILDLLEDDLEVARGFISSLAMALQMLWVLKARGGHKVY